MADNPLDSVYSLAERTYVRLQAGDVLIRCLEEESVRPIQELVEGLILVGPESLDALREILAETSQRKAQVQDDLHQVFLELRTVLEGYGINLEGIAASEELLDLTPLRLLTLMQEQDLHPQVIRESCLQVLQNSQDLRASLEANLRLLADAEAYLQDWLFGLAYQSARQTGVDADQHSLSV